MPFLFPARVYDGRGGSVLVRLGWSGLENDPAFAFASGAGRAYDLDWCSTNKPSRALCDAESLKPGEP